MNTDLERKIDNCFERLTLVVSAAYNWSTPKLLEAISREREVAKGHIRDAQEKAAR